MHFAEPVFLAVALVLGLVLVALYVRAARARRRTLALLASKHLLARLTASVSNARRLAKAVMIVAGVVLLSLALARPQFGRTWQETHRRGVDLLFAVDTSKSMLTRDVKPDRLTRAKLAVRDLVEKFPSDRVGLLAFAGTAFLETPLTLDHAIFEQSLDALDTRVIPAPGTDVTSAIEAARTSLAGDEHKKVLILLTDGEDLAGDARAAANEAAKDGLVIYTVGVGTPRGELIPEPGKDGRTEFVKDDDGRLVTSKLDESLLRDVAAATGGTYRPLGDDGRGLEALYHDELSSLPRSDLAARAQEVPIERFQWPLAAAVLLLGLEPFVGERRRRVASRRAKSSVRVRTFAGARLTAAALGGMSALLLVPSAFATPQSAERAYAQGHFAAAQSDYAGAERATPGDPRLGFNLGAAAYRNGDIDAATKAFAGALRTGDLQLQERAYYDLGDAMYRGGQKKLGDGKTEDAIAAWKGAISQYESALRLEKTDADAEYNLDFVKKKLAELEKKQDEQKKKDENKAPSGGKNEKQTQGGTGGKSGDSAAPSEGSSANARGGKGPSETKPPSSGDGSHDESAQRGETPRVQGAGQGRPQPGHGPAQTPDGPPDRGQRPQAAQGDLQPVGENGQGRDAEEATRPSRPGELSKAEATGLLDSLRGELKVGWPSSQGAQHTPETQSGKDW